MVKVLYQAEARVTGGRAQGHGRTAGGELEVDLRVPKELGGEGGATNPEQLFAVGYAACFESALTQVGQRNNLNTGNATIDSKVMLLPIGKGQFKLGVGMDITLPSIEDPEQAARMVREADRVCPYSNATRGNIDVEFVVNSAPLAV
jgi:Ohr subfamily peroxiredoxin